MHEKVLVTGGAGYIGSVLCGHLLDAGYQVVVLDNLMYGQSSLFHLCNNPNFTFIRGDARDDHLLATQVSKVDVIIPLAALVGAPACDADPNLAWSVNLGAIQTLNRIKADDQLVIFPNTNSGYGTQTNICTEDTPLDPISTYGRSKQIAEYELLDATNTIVLRLATVFGVSPRMRTDLLVNDFTYKAVTDGYLVLFEAGAMRNYVHVDDVADCFVHCIENRDHMVGRPFNVGLDDANISKAELAVLIQKYIPFSIYKGPGEDPDKRDYVVSNQRLKEAGFIATRSLDQGIQELIKAYSMMPRGVYRNA